MIVKKVKNPKKSSSKGSRTGRLIDYVREPERENLEEKCIYAGARGFITDEPESQKAEMLALSQEAVRSRDPLNHYVLSWHEGEQPSPKQVEEAVGLFMDELGVSEHQAVYGLHADTDNIHLHIVINRVHPDTLKVVQINRGFDIEAAHRAIARIELAQGWQREQNGRYRVLENGELEKRGLELEPGRSRQPEQSKRDMEARTGEKSAERIAIETGAPTIARARSWAELHRELGVSGMRYEKTGSGAVLFVGEVGVKASRADRAASLVQLQKRLGPYEARSYELGVSRERMVERRAPEPIQKGVPGWEVYIAGRRAHGAVRDAAYREVSVRQEAERVRLAAEQAARREALLDRGWKGRGNELNVLRSVLAAEQAGERAALKERHQLERSQLRELYRPYPDLEQWQRLEKRPELAEQWRYRASEPQRLEGDRGEAPTVRDIRDYRAEIRGEEVHYLRREAPESAVSFVDMGRQIDVHEWRSQESVLAALQLGAQKWGRIQVSGNEDYKSTCVRLAAKEGFAITNPELQERIAQERVRLEQERAQGLRSESIQASERALAPKVQRHELKRELAISAVPGSASDAYGRHYRDLLSRQEGQAMELSRVDALIAVRMRVTGHGQEEIEGALRQCAPLTRQQEEGRDWSDYARRTARYAFSAAGERQVAALGEQRLQWELVERREHARQREQERGHEHKGPSLSR